MDFLRKNEKNIILALVVCGLVVIIGVSFAFFSSNINIGGNGTSVSGGTSNLVEVTYDAGTATLALTDAYPGKSATKDFSVTINPKDSLNNTAKYAIVLKIDANDFEYDVNNTEELAYTLTDNTSNLTYTGYIPLGSLDDVELAVPTKTVSVATTYNYTLKLEFLDTNVNQNHNANATLSGSLQVDFAE